ncbi:DUF1302 family protein [Endozoicomonas acroporae]|uniref:DUF1302 family protein n=2 Tax=Endozoicomonas TaxID=305899 RepID=UPI003D7ADB3F
MKRFKGFVGVWSGVWLAVGLLSPGSVLASDTFADISLDTTLRSELAYGLNRHGVSKVRTTLEPELSGVLGISLAGEQPDFLIKPRFSLDLADDLTTRTDRPESYSSLNGPTWETRHGRAELVEAWLEAEWDTVAGPTAVRLGKQQVVWGQADSLRVLDVVNPLNYREWTLSDYEDIRIPTWMANIEIADIGGPGEDASLQWLIIPDMTFNELVDAGSPFAVTSPELVPRPQPGVPVVVHDTQRPGRGHLETGLRWSSFVQGWDLAALMFYHYQDNPVLYRSFDEGRIAVSPEYQRTLLYGLSASNAFADWVVRLELAYSTRNAVLREDLVDQGIYTTGEMTSVLGLDYQGLDNWFLSYQFYQSTLNNRPAAVIRKQTTVRHTLLGRRDFWNDTLELELKGLHNQDYNDGMLRAKLSWDVNDSWRLWTGADLFYGDDDGPFGQFREQDRLVLGAEITF